MVLNNSVVNKVALEEEDEFIEDHPKKVKRHRGVVMTLVHGEGFGFIADEYDGQERFFHMSWIKDPDLVYGDIFRGQTLSFLPISSDKGYKAINLSKNLEGAEYVE